MTYDLAVWHGERPADDEAAAVFEALCDRYLDADEPIPPVAPIRQYVEALLAHWPDLNEEGGEGSPWAGSPLLDEAAGPIIYLTIVWGRAEEASAYAAELARARGLVCFDPQAERLRP